MTSPKPGDPDFKPRYHPLDLAPIRKRIEERREAAKFHPMRDVLDADTDMMAELVLAVTNLRTALDVAIRPPPPSSADGPMQKCFSCSNWVPVGGPAKCDVCRREDARLHPALTLCSGGCGGGRAIGAPWICDACRPRTPVTVDDPYAERDCEDDL